MGRGQYRWERGRTNSFRSDRQLQGGAKCKQFEGKILLLTVGQLRQYFLGVKVWGRTFSIGKESAVSYLDKGFEDALDELKQTVMIKAFTEGDDSLLYMDRDLLDPQLFMVVFSLVLGSMA
ncbi:hypothetical protein [uncultured Fibrobacter sp.]|uniref:hypothetical protein n=1 Tax=uncultured Fibrobacter sp. TaxID=261512 RepID=UPI002804EF43|nr:hypothetical protein [uncultured Fibrobacter sp.]